MQLNKIIIGIIDLLKALKIEKYTEFELGDESEPWIDRDKSQIEPWYLDWIPARLATRDKSQIKLTTSNGT